MNKETKFTRIEIILYFLFAVILCVLLLGSYLINSSLNEFRGNFEKFSYNKLVVTNPLNFNIPDNSEVSIKISKENIDILNAHLNYINNKNEEAIEMSHKTIDSDINRLNTFISVGIGLLGLIGIVLPIVTTFFQTEAIRSKISEFDGKFEKIDEEKIDNLVEKITNLEMHVPKIHILTLQYYIGRLLSYNKYNEIGKNTLSDIIGGIIKGFNICDENQIKNDEFFKDTIKDFQKGIQIHQISFYGLTDNKKGQKNVTSLNDVLKKLLNNDGNINEVIKILNLFNSK